VDWRKCSYSGAQGGECVETASSDSTIIVRDTANREDETLTFTAAAWITFTAALK